MFVHTVIYIYLATKTSIMFYRVYQKGKFEGSKKAEESSYETGWQMGVVKGKETAQEVFQKHYRLMSDAGTYVGSLRFTFQFGFYYGVVKQLSSSDETKDYSPRYVYHTSQPVRLPLQNFHES